MKTGAGLMWESRYSRRRSVFAREIPPPSSTPDLRKPRGRRANRGSHRCSFFGKKRAVTRRIPQWQHNSAIPNIFLREISPNIYIFWGGTAKGIRCGACDHGRGATIECRARNQSEAEPTNHPRFALYRQGSCRSNNINNTFTRAMSMPID